MTEISIGGETISVKVANRFYLRFCGLMFKKSLDQNSGLHLNRLGEK